MADFAKAQLLKYGWTEGKGLGKNENGITTAIKPSLKFDTAGIGHKYTDGNEWWEIAFNKAASNIMVDTQNTGVTFSISKNETVDVRKRKTSIKSKQKNQYGNFLKSSTLSNGTLVLDETGCSSETPAADVDVTHVPLTDEELFKACGGRTAHKGARHGLTSSGKLERIARQEELLLSRATCSNKTNTTLFYTEAGKEHSLKKRKGNSDEDDDQTNSNKFAVLPLCILSPEAEEPVKLSKQTRRRHNRRMNDLTHQLNVLCKVDDNDDVKKDSFSRVEETKKKVKRQKAEDRVSPDSGTDERITEGKLEKGEQAFLTDDTKVKKKKKRKSKRRRSESSQDRGTYCVELEEMHKSQKKKSRKMHAKNVETENQRSSSGGIHDSEQDSSYETENTDTAEPPEGYKREIRRLNHKIKRKKEAQLCKRTKIKLEQITESLQAVHFNSENALGSCDPLKKVDCIINDLAAEGLTENVSEKIKKKSRKKDKRNQGKH